MPALPKSHQTIPWLIRKWWHLSLIAFAFWSIGFGMTLCTRYNLSRHGKTIDATIIGEYGQKKKMVTCTFEVNGMRYTTSASTPQDSWHSSVEYSPGLIGRKVLVTYDPANPGTNLGGDLRGRFAEDFCISTIGILALSAFVGFFGHLLKQDWIKKNRRKTEALAE